MILARRQHRVNAADDPPQEAVKTWRSFKGKARDDVLVALQDMCWGLQRCMYCQDSLGTDIDHFRPKVDYPERSYEWDNYILACSHCNSNYKRDKFPVKDGKELLVDPTSVDPSRHLALSLDTGNYVGLDEVGVETIKVFGLNRDVCVQGRRTAWIALCALIRDYERSSDDARAEILDCCKKFPFQDVRHALARTISGSDRADVVPAEVRAVVSRHRELLD